jgi:hypothetical protein
MAARPRLILAANIAAVIAAGVLFVVYSHRTVPPVAQPYTAAPPPVAAPAAAMQAPRECLLPGPPPVAPEGATASADEMRLGHTVIQNFVFQLEHYQTCRNTQLDHPPPGTTEQQKQAWLEQGNAAVDEAHAVANAFSAQLKIFNARNGGQTP